MVEEPGSRGVMRNFDSFFRERLDDLKTEGRYRSFADLERIAGRFPRALYRATPDAAAREVTVWCSNDYLGIGQHPALAEAMHASISKSGAGAGGTRNISGTSHEIVQLERELAAFHGKEAGLVFTSGYISNEAALGTLAKHMPEAIVFSDTLNHASMIAGIRNSRCEYQVFRHNDAVHLRQLLAACDPNRPKIVAFESVYSMDGDIAPLKDLLDVCEEFNALAYLDEVHAVGLYGATGAGIAEREGLAHRFHVIEGTLGKAFGLIGGYITGSAPLVDFVRSFAPGFIFTTALPPAVAAGARASLKVIRGASDLRARHQAIAADLKKRLAAAGLPVMASESHIVPVRVGDPKACKRVAAILLEQHGIYVQPINYPTVPKGTERLRLTPTPLHGEAEVAQLIAALSSVWRELSLPVAA
ncbi:5-aminolevulinate synthase [Dongia sp. agr-C8]